MAHARILTILLSLIHLTSCGVKITESGKSISEFVLGSVSPLKGLISHHSPQSFQLIQNAYSASCPAGVSVDIHPLDSDGQIDFTTIVASAPLQADTSFSVPRSSLPELSQTTVRYIARVVGCHDRILMRPLTSSLTPEGEDIIQDITYTTTLISASHNSESQTKLNQVSKKEVEEFINAVGSSSSEVDAFNSITTKTNLTSRFENMFNSAPSVLQNAAPKINPVVPKTISENTPSEFRAIAHHWSPAYEIAYLWKLNGTSTSTDANWSFSPGANDQGTHTITLYVGRDDGLGEIDLDLPYTMTSFQLQIQNTILPQAPILSLNSTEHSTSTISDTLVHLKLNTGAEQINCQSFSALALSESATRPSSSSAFTIECDTNFEQELTYTLSPADGNKTLYLWAIDSSGTISTTARTLSMTLDRNPPTIGFTNLASSIRGDHNYLIEWSSSDVSGVAEHKLYYSVDGSNYTLIVDELVAQSYLWSVPAINTSTLTLKLEAIDTIGNLGEIVSSNRVVDSTAPVVSITSPAANTPSQGQVTITGACETGALNVVVTGGIVGSISAACSAGTYSATIELSGADGAKAVTVTQADQVGNSSNQSRSFVKDTTAPVLTQTTSASGIYLNTDTVTIGGACEGSLAITIGGTDSAVVNCNSNAWTYETEAQTNDGVYPYTIRSTDLAGNQSAVVNYTWNRDTQAPIVQSITINDGEASTANRNTVIDMTASSERADIQAFCMKVNTSVNPTTNDTCWVQVSSLGQSITASLTITNYPLQLGFTLGTYTVSAWTKDELGNVSSITNTLGVDKSEIGYTPIPPAVISSLISTATDTPSDPLAPIDIQIAEDSDLYIKWSITDENPIPAGSIDLLWTENGTTFYPLANDLNDGTNGACTLTGLQTGCALLSGASPTSTYFNVVLSVRNQNSLETISTSNPLNTASFQLLSGNTSLGIGGSASSSIIFSRGESMLSDKRYGQFVVTSSGDIYTQYEGRGLAQVSSLTGDINILSAQTGSSTGDNGPLSNATFRDIQRILLTYDDQLLIWDHDRVRKIDLSNPDKTITRLFGGGANSSDGADAHQAQLPSMSSTYQMVTVTPNDRVYFEKNLEIWFFDPTDNTVKKYLTLNGTGADNMALGTSADFEWENCETRNTAIDFSSSTSQINKIIRRAVFNTTSNCGNHNRKEESFNGNFNVTTGETQLPHPARTMWSSVNFTGMNGKIYTNSMYHQILEYDENTNSFISKAGVYNTSGRCSDGSLATTCNLNAKSIFVDRFGKIFFNDLGVFRTIDNEGRVQTIAGQARNFGVGENPLAARYSNIYFFDYKDETIYVRNESENQIVKFSLAGGNLELVAGNGIQSSPSNNSNAASSPLPNNSWSTPTSFVVQPAENKIFHRVGGRFSFINTNTGNWSVGTTDIHVKDGTVARPSYLHSNGSKLLVYSSAHLGGLGEQSYLMELSLDGTEVDIVMGVNENLPSSTPTNYCDGDNSLTCGIPGTLSDFYQTRAKHDSVLGAWLIGYAGRNYINSLPYGGGITARYVTTTHNLNAFDYADIEGTRYLYYCSTGGFLYRRNLTSGVEAQLPLPSPTIKCGGRSMFYSSTRESLLFSFQQNGLWGIAEYLLP